MSIHPSAIVHPRAEIDPTVEVGPWCVIDEHVRVGPGCRLFHNVYLTGWTEIGEGCVLHPGVVVGHEPQDVKYKGERSFCRVGRGAVIREYVTIHRGTVPESATTVGENSFLLEGCHIAHNCTVGDNVTLINKVLLAGYVEVGDRATLGGSAGIHQFVRIGELSMVAGVARVTMDIVPFALTDADGQIVGLNRVGLRRAGLPREDVLDVREAYRVLFFAGLPFREAIQQVNGTVNTPAGRRLAQFLANSRRGFAAGSRKRRRGDDEE